MSEEKIPIPNYSYNYPEEIKFCKKCVIPNTRPSSRNEYTHTNKSTHDYIQFDEGVGVCSACRFVEKKYNEEIDWNAREKELEKLLDKHRSKNGSYDVLVPGSGGKDSGRAAHVLKAKYGMHPLTVTWAPHLYTDIGWKNLQNWAHVGGFDNYLFTPNGEIHRLLTRNAFKNLLHPFQPFILGQKTFATKMAVKFNIPLIFYGASPGEAGARVSIKQKKFDYTGSKKNETHNAGFRLNFVDPNADPDKVFLGGQSVAEYLKSGVTMGELAPFLPLDPNVAQENNIEFHYLGYYMNWVPQECYYYSQKHAGFEANPDRTEGTYSKYVSLDDKTDGYFYYTTYIKFGYGRATQDAAQEIRHGHITRGEGAALVNRFDGEFPKKYFKEFLEYISMNEDEFFQTTDAFRHPHLWKKKGDEWLLRYKVR